MNVCWGEKTNVICQQIMQREVFASIFHTHTHTHTHTNISLPHWSNESHSMGGGGRLVESAGLMTSALESRQPRVMP
jgi:hypothetical protein